MRIRIGEGELKLLGNGQIEELSFRDGSIFPKGQFSWLIRAFRDGKEVGIRLVDREKDRLLYHWEKTEEPLVMQVTETYIFMHVRMIWMRQSSRNKLRISWILFIKKQPNAAD